MPAFCAACQRVWPSGMSTDTDSISNVTLGIGGSLQAQAVSTQQAFFDLLQQHHQILAAELALCVLLEGERVVHQVAGDEVRRLLLQLIGEERGVVGAA